MWCFVVIIVVVEVLIFQGIEGMVLYYYYMMVMMWMMVWVEVGLVGVVGRDSALLRALYPKITKIPNTRSVTIYLYINYIDIMT